jgi:lysophospholipase L1-like esterase
VKVKKKLVILSDSLGRPRPDLSVAEATEYEETYGYLLREKLGDEWIVDICYVESLDSIDAKFWAERMVAFRRPDIAILHLGINDCAPRVFKKNARPIIYSEFFKKITFNFFAKLVNRFRYHLTKFNKLVYVSSEDYIANLESIKESILKYSPDCKITFVGIADTSDANDKRSYNYRKNIALYNKVLKEFYVDNYIDVNTIPQDKLIISDGIHLTKYAHQELAKTIFNRLFNGF